ncbi:hypothetical protein F5Y03DRAFT_393329 [Xylaria venustula]|nr:hypothetical protein F5Y03DRAFT_393329 [Xylaria venustula]
MTLEKLTKALTHAQKPPSLDNEPPWTMNPLAPRISPIECSTHAHGVLPPNTSDPRPNLPSEPPPDEHGDTREHPDSQAKKPRTRIFVHGVLQDRRETEQNSQRRAPTGWAESTFLQRKAGQEGWMRKTNAGVTEERARGEREPLCFYGGAFPRSLLERGVRGLSPKAVWRDDENEVSVCSFDSDLLGEGVVEGIEELTIEISTLRGFVFFFAGGALLEA